MKARHRELEGIREKTDELEERVLDARMEADDSEDGFREVYDQFCDRWIFPEKEIVFANKLTQKEIVRKLDWRMKQMVCGSSVEFLSVGIVSLFGGFFRVIFVIFEILQIIEFTIFCIGPFFFQI